MAKIAKLQFLKGLNAVGMGAYSPVPIVNEALHNRIMQEVIELQPHWVTLSLRRKKMPML